MIATSPPRSVLYGTYRLIAGREFVKDERKIGYKFFITVARIFEFDAIRITNQHDKLLIKNRDRVQFYCGTVSYNIITRVRG
jgi:hypothetical protein